MQHPSGGGDGTHGHPASARQLMFLFSSGARQAGKQQNRATKDSTRLFSRFTFIICAAHAVGHLFKKRERESECTLAGWRLLLAAPTARRI
jgi:hypothetical protein